MDTDALTPAQARILDAIRKHGPVSEAVLASILYGDNTLTGPLQRPLRALANATLILHIESPHRVIGALPVWRAYGKPSP